MYFLMVFWSRLDLSTLWKVASIFDGLVSEPTEEASTSTRLSSPSVFSRRLRPTTSVRYTSESKLCR